MLHNLNDVWPVFIVFISCIHAVMYAAICLRLVTVILGGGGVKGDRRACQWRSYWLDGHNHSSSEKLQSICMLEEDWGWWCWPQYLGLLSVALVIYLNQLTCLKWRTGHIRHGPQKYKVSEKFISLLGDWSNDNIHNAALPLDNACVLLAFIYLRVSGKIQWYMYMYIVLKS